MSNYVEVISKITKLLNYNYYIGTGIDCQLLSIFCTYAVYRIEKYLPECCHTFFLPTYDEL